MSNQKKIKPVNIIMDCIIAGVVIVLIIVIASSFFNNSKDDAKESASKAKSTAAPKSLAIEEGVENYECVIAEDSSNDTVFYVSFNSNDMTYEETITAASQSSSLDEGTYEVKDGKYVTKSAKTNSELTYVKDGEYLIVESEMFEGELPDGDTFDGTFVYEIKDEVKTTVTFKKDGTYQQEVISYAAKSSSSEDTTENTTGKYTRDGKFIKRSADNGDPLLDFYIYDNKISNAYYKLAEAE